mgnify:CR=1 FL=1
MPLLSKNDAYVATRAKSRKKSLIDGTRMRQLLQQTPEQLSISIADSGYRNEIDLYASGFQGSDLVEAALTHNLENELSNIVYPHEKDEYPEKDSKTSYSNCVINEKENNTKNKQDEEKDKNKNIYDNNNKGGTLDVIKIYTSKKPSESEKKSLEKKN